MWIQSYTPFNTPTLVVWDSLRIVIIVGGFTLIAASIYMMAHTRLPARFLLTVGLIAFTVAGVGTEIEHLGDHATYRLFTNLAGVCIGLGGTFVARREP